MERRADWQVAWSSEGFDAADIMGGLYGDGIIGLKGAFSTDFADRMREDIETLFEEARQVPGGALPRGPERFYVEVQPERIRGFVDIVTHPWFVAVCEAVLGPDYRIVEVGFDIPFPGRRRPALAPRLRRAGSDHQGAPAELARLQPDRGRHQAGAWARSRSRSGTQWDQFDGCPRACSRRASSGRATSRRAVQKLPQRGDISARSALTIHRGTANRSNEARPVLVVGVDAPDATNAAASRPAGHPRLCSRRCRRGCSDHLTYRVVDQLETVVQHHVIEGLLTPAY